MKMLSLLVLLTLDVNNASVVLPVSLQDGRAGDLVCESLSSLLSCAQSASAEVGESSQALALVQSALQSLQIEKKDGLEEALDYSKIAACTSDGIVVISPNPNLSAEIVDWLSTRIVLSSVIRIQEEIDNDFENQVAQAIVTADDDSAILVLGANRCRSQSSYLERWRSVLDVHRGILGDGGVDILIKRPSRDTVFETKNANRLLSRLTTRIASERNSKGGACTMTEARALGRQFADRPSLGDTEHWDFMSLLGCPTRNWLRRWSIDQRNHAKTKLAFVGANKGYGLAALLRDLVPSPRLNVTPASWGKSLRAQGARLAMGWCRDGLDDAYVQEETKTIVEALLIEPLISNVQLIEHALKDAGFQYIQDSWWFHDIVNIRLEVACAGNTIGSTRFPHLAPGEEVGAAASLSIAENNEQQYIGHFADDTNPSFDTVPVITLDSILPPNDLDALFIDAEGADPIIIFGAYANVIPRLRLLEFEYHAKGYWQNISLASLITQLDSEYGFDCFLQGPRGDDLWRLSRGCWDQSFEIHRWSNVVCAARSDPFTTALLNSYAVVL